MISFGTGGWREIIGDGFTKENVHRIALALASVIKEGSVVIGYDRRFLSKEASFWFIEALASQGIRSLFINRSSPTPVIMYAVKQMGCKYGAAITASHNPAIYNGIKIFVAEGKDAPVEVTAELSRLANTYTDLSTFSIKPFHYVEKTSLYSVIDPFNDYIDSILDYIDVKAIRNARLRIAIDPMYGVSQTSLTTILATARCDIEFIHGRHDTLFGGKLPSPASDSLHRLMDLVVEKHFHLGVATDGDADRIGIVDELGNFIHPNMLLCLLYSYFLKFKGWRGPVVRNLSTTHMLDRIAEKYGEKCIETEVGFKYISAAIEANGAVLGGESSGGLTVKGHIHGKDGIFAAALLIEMMSVTGKTLHQLVEELHEEFGVFLFSENGYRFTEEKAALMKSILFEKKDVPDYENIKEVNYMDGLKIIFQDGSWISARFSGTEPVLRIFAEAGKKELLTTYVEKMESLLSLTSEEKI